MLEIAVKCPWCGKELLAECIFDYGSYNEPESEKCPHCREEFFVLAKNSRTYFQRHKSVALIKASS